MSRKETLEFLLDGTSRKKEPKGFSLEFSSDELSSEESYGSLSSLGDFIVDDFIMYANFIMVNQKKFLEVNMYVERK